MCPFMDSDKLVLRSKSVIVVTEEYHDALSAILKRVNVATVTIVNWRSVKNLGIISIVYF
jgi:hypothetical protein